MLFNRIHLPTMSITYSHVNTYDDSVLKKCRVTQSPIAHNKESQSRHVMVITEVGKTAEAWGWREVG